MITTESNKAKFITLLVGAARRKILAVVQWVKHSAIGPKWQLIFKFTIYQWSGVLTWFF